ncbi:MAG: FAD:protein FMN transferase [Oscillospiraceae bacterium]
MARFKYHIIAIIMLCLIMLISILYKNDDKPLNQKMFFSMDTIITLETPNLDIANQIQSQIEDLNQIFDRHLQGTELYILNEEKSINSDILYSLIIETSKLNKTYGYNVDIASGNLVDLWNISENPTIPNDEKISQALKNISMDNVRLNIPNKITLLNGVTLDIGAVAKGYTLDVIKSQLDTSTTENTLVSMGSSTLLYNVEDYPIMVRSPEDTQNVVCKFYVDGIAYVSTSGGYERYIEIDGVKYPHILDLSTGYPVTTDLTSVTIYTDSGIKSDFLSTYIFMEGTEGLEKYLKDDTIKVIAIDNAKNIYVSSNFDVEILDSSFKVVS